MCLIRCVRAFDSAKQRPKRSKGKLFSPNECPRPKFHSCFNLHWPPVDFLWSFFYRRWCFLPSQPVWPPHIEMFVLRVRDLIQTDQNKNVHIVFLCNQFYLNLIMRIARARHSCAGGHFHTIQMLFLFPFFAPTVAELPLEFFSHSQR